MNNNFIDTSVQRFLRVICPNTVPKTIQNGKMLMVYDDQDMVVGCFFSAEECAKYFKTTPKYLKKLIYGKQKLYEMYRPIWVTTSRRKKGWHFNKGEI